MGSNQPRVTGKPKAEININLLVQAVLLIAEQRLLELEAAERRNEPLDSEHQESA